MKEKKQFSMTQGPMAMAILLYTIPIILTSVLQLLFNAADLVIVGRYCGSICVAAVGSTGPMTNMVVNLFIGLSVGAGVTVAHGLGSREHEIVFRTVHTALPTAIVSGVLITVIGIAYTDPLLRMMDTPENVLPLSSMYIKIYFGGMTFNMVYNFCASILRAAGDTKSPLIILSIAGVINVLLNIFFVTVANLNVAGVALATTISQALSAVVVVMVLMRRKDCCRFYPRKMHFYKPQLEKMIRIGVPAGIQSSMFSISNTIIQASINSFGDVMMSANAAVSNLEGFCFVIVNGFHQTAVNYVGQNAGAQKMDRVKKTYLLCMIYAVIFGLAEGIAGTYFAPQLLSLYITDSPEAIAIGAARMVYTTLPYLIFGMMDVTTGALRGIGASTESMIITILGVCGIRVGWICTVFRLPQFHTPLWLYLTYPASWIITFTAQAIAFYLVYKREKAYCLAGEEE